MYNIFYQQYQKHPAKDMNGEPIGGFIGSVNAVQKLALKFMPSEIYCVFDGVGAGQRRRSVFSGYKDKRGRKSRSTCVTFNDEHKEYVDNEQYQIQLLFNCLKQLPVKLLAVTSYEADDIIAHKVLEHKKDSICIISSMDKDYLQLVDENVCVWHPQKEVLFTPATLQEKYDIIANNFVYMRCVIGDPSDKLIGVKGIGGSSLFEALPDLKTKPYKDFWEFWEAIEQIPDDGSKTMQKLKEGKKVAHMMYNLMNLKQSTLSLMAIEEMNEQLRLQDSKQFSKFSFKLYCIKDNLESILKNFEIWIRPFTFIKLA